MTTQFNDTYDDSRDRKLCDRLGWPASDVCEHTETETHRRGGDIWDTCHDCGEEVHRRLGSQDMGDMK